MIELRSGPYRSGKQAEAFLARRLAGRVVVPVSQLLADAEREGIDQATVRRAAERLGVTKPVCWALPESAPQQAIVEAEEQAVAVEAQRQAAAAETDPRVEQAVAEVSELIAEGLGRDSAIHRTCRGDRELAARVLKKLAR